MSLFRPILLLCLLLAGAGSTSAASPDFTPLESMVNKAVSDSVFPGATLAVLSRGRMVYHRAFGRMTYDPKSSPVDTSTIYDLASLTKAVATTSMVMQLVDRDSLALEAPVSHYLLDFRGGGKEKITIRQLLQHTSGLRAHRYFAESCKSPEELFKAIDADSLLTAPGTTTLYSDLGFMLLGKVIETLTHKTLDANFRDRFAVPLAMKSTMFNPSQSLAHHIAPVGQDGIWPFSTERPLVHDQNAALLGGVSGHAGLYSTSGDLARMVTMLMKGGSLNNQTFFHAETLKKFLSPNESLRLLGWDRPSPGGHSSSGEFFSASSYGHLGFTGTSIWIDPEKELAVIFLSNRVYPSAENIKIRAFRPLLHNTIWRCLALHPIRQTDPASAPQAAAPTAATPAGKSN